MLQSLPSTLLIWALKFLLVLSTAILSCRAEEIEEDDERRIQIVVLGDIGRSPRMQYHALSVANNGGYVELVGYRDSDLYPDISRHENITIRPLPYSPTYLNTKNRHLFVLFGPLKVLFQLWSLWRVLYLTSRHSGWMLVQNPPSIPTLAVSVVVCRLRTTRLVIDWHNLGFSLLSLKLGGRHPLVVASRFYENMFGAFAYAHICVTDTMSRFLMANSRISTPIRTLHDRPASIFHSLQQNERLEFLDRVLLSLSKPISQQVSMHFNILGPGASLKTSPVFLDAQSALDAVKNGSAKLLVSSTSWTADEDFSILLDALTGYCHFIQSKAHTDCFKIVVMITGKGPGRSAFETKVRNLNCNGDLSQVLILTAYFDDVNDYAQLLGSADLGVSLHTSSSGVDLPMKVLDMFGAGLPVVGWSDFEAWPELVKEGHNGLGFSSADGLEKLLEALFRADSRLLKKLQRGALEEGERRWEDEWRPVCGRLLGLLDSGNSK